MNRSNFSMLPSLRYDSPADMPVMERDGFVDESVIQALLAGPVVSRHVPHAEDLALAAHDMDFAGWKLTGKLPAAATEAAAGPIRRAAPPELDEPGLGEPHRGTHRWWLAGLAGALSTLLFSVLLLSLSSREHPELEAFSIIRQPAKHPMDAPTKAPASKMVPELTDLATDK